MSATSDAVFLVDPHDGRTTGTIAVASPSAILAVGDSIWVSSSEQGTVSRIDEASRAVTQTTPVGVQPSDLVAAAGSIWVASALDGTVSRLDPATGLITDRFPAGKAPGSMAFDGTSLWVLSATDATLTKIDPSTDRATATVDLPAAGADIAFGAGSLWVSAANGPRVWKIDPGSRSVLTRRTLGTSVGSIVAAAGWIWVADPLDGTLWKLRASDGTPNTVTGVGDFPSGLAIDRGTIWVADRDAGSVVAVDAATNVAQPAVQLEPGARPWAVAAADGTVWVPARVGVDAHRGGTLRLLSSERCMHVDPASMPEAEISCWDSLSITTDVLLGFERVAGREGLRLVPDLALAVPPDRGATTLTFPLRPGIRYSDGTPLRPADFRRALERMIVQGFDGGVFDAIDGVPACRAAIARTSAGGCDLSAGVGTDASAGTVTFHLSGPDPDLLYKLIRLIPVPPGTPIRNTGTHPVPGTGPYRIVSVAHRSMSLERNPYFREWSEAAQPAGYPDRIAWTFGAPPGVEVNAVEAGQADWSLDPPPRNRLLQIRNTDAGRFHVVPIMGTYFLIMNTKLPPFDDVRVRRVLSAALDRRTALRSIGGATFGSRTCDLIPPEIPGSGVGCPAGSAPGHVSSVRLSATRVRTPVPVKTTTLNGVDFDRLGRWVASVLRQLGIPARARPTTSARFFPSAGVPTRQQYLAVVPWAVDYPSASDFLQLFSCSSIRPHAAFDPVNWSNFCDKRIDAANRRALADEARGRSARARAEWAHFDRLLVSDVPVIPLVRSNEADLVSARVGNVEVHPIIGLLLSQLWVR